MKSKQATKLPPEKLSETDLQNLVKGLLERAPAIKKFWRNNTGRRGYIKFGLVGAPDFIGFTRQGYFLGVEVKGGKDTRTKDQRDFAAELMQTKKGIYACICNTDDLAYFQQALDAILVSD